MNLLVVGLNHKTADVEVRERLAFGGAKLEDGLKRITALDDVNEAVILSTCNRVEMYLNVKDPVKAEDELIDFFSEFHSIRHELLRPSLYFHTGDEAVRHAFRVASSLDSMVVGEPQITGQLKDAFDASLKFKTTGILLNKLMKKSLSVAKRVRTETRISALAVSISYAAVELAKKVFEDLGGKNVLLLGAGEMAELAAKHLVNSGVAETVVANRTFATGCELAKDMGGRAVKFEDFPDEMLTADIVICSTGAPTYVVTKPMMKDIMKKRKQEPMFIIDISVPRNIDPELDELDNVYRYDVDDLQGVVDTNVGERRKEAELAEGIIAEEIETFKRWLSSLEAVPTILALRERADRIMAQEVERFMGKHPDLGEKEIQAINRLTAGIVSKLIHPPTAALKEDAEDKDILIATIKRIYGLD